MRSRSFILAGVVVVAGCSTDPVTGPDVTIMRLTASGIDESCFTVMTSALPAKELGLTDLCATASAPHLIAGVDELRLVIDYKDVEFPGTTNAAVPTVQVTVDGTTIDAGTALLPERRIDGRTFFVATLTTPNVVTANLQFAVSVNQGFQTIVPTIFRADQPIEAISVLKRTAQNCSLVIAGEPPASALGLPTPCTGDSPLGQLNAGSDQIEIVVDYGNVDFPGATTKVPAPTFGVLVDHKEIAVPIAVPPAKRAGGHVFFVGTMNAPAVISPDFRLTVTAVPGHTAFVSQIFNLQPPPIGIAIQECGESCEREGAVGSIHARIAIPGEIPQSIIIRNVIDGVVSDLGAATLTTELGVGETFQTATMAVPTAADGAKWRLEVQLGASRARSNEITIRKPRIVTSLSCGTICALASGAQVGLTVTAPRLISSHEASITTRLDGVPVTTNSALDLISDVDTNTSVGVTTLTTPTSPGTWTIDVSVAGYRASTINVTVQ